MMPSELGPAALLYPVAQVIVAGLCGVVLSWILLEHYRDYRHQQRRQAQRVWQTYQGGSVRADLQEPRLVNGRYTVTDDGTEDCAP